MNFDPKSSPVSNVSSFQRSIFEDFPPREVWSFGQSFSAMVDFPGFKTSNPKAKPAHAVQRVIDWGETLEKSLMNRSISWDGLDLNPKTRGPSDHVQFQLRDMGLSQNYLGKNKNWWYIIILPIEEKCNVGVALIRKKNVMMDICLCQQHLPKPIPTPCGWKIENLKTALYIEKDMKDHFFCWLVWMKVHRKPMLPFSYPFRVCCIFIRPLTLKNIHLHFQIFGLSTTTSWHAKCWTLNPVTTCHCRSCARVQAQKTCCLMLSSFSEMVVLNWQPRQKTYGANLIAKGDFSTLSSLQVGEIHRNPQAKWWGISSLLAMLTMLVCTSCSCSFLVDDADNVLTGTSESGQTCQ